MKAPSIVEFTTDAQLLGLTVSPAQETLLRAIYGLDLVDAEQLDLWRRCTGRETYPGRPFPEVTVIAGARAGKDSRIAAPIAVYEALFGGHHHHLGLGERGVVPIVAQDLRATRIAFGYVKSYLTESNLLAGEVDEVLASEIRLRNGITVVCFPCRAAATRGWSIPAGVLDELAFYRLEGQADSDVEVQASVRRGMLAFPRPRLVKIGTPYLKSGLMHDDFRISYGQDDPHRLVWRAPSLLMNPTITASALKRERALDPSRYAREYEAEFAEDLDAFLPAAWVEAAVVVGRHELPPVDGVVYVAAIDASGSGKDAFTTSVCHTEDRNGVRVIVQDLLRGWRRRGGELDLEGVVTEIARLVKPYRVTRVLSDRYAAGCVRQAVERNGLVYIEAPVKSEAYLATEPLFAASRVEILDHEEQRRELVCLERTLKPGGRAVVDHPRGGHDDHANVLALAAAELESAARRSPVGMFNMFTGRPVEPWWPQGPYDHGSLR
jgi:hypothetical protein